MDYKTHLKVALQHLQEAEAQNPKLSPIINEVARAYKGRPKIRRRNEKQLSFLTQSAAINIQKKLDEYASK